MDFDKVSVIYPEYFQQPGIYMSLISSSLLPVLIPYNPWTFSLPILYLNLCPSNNIF